MSNKVHFKGFNGIRFFAAFAVIITHIEGFKSKANFANVSSITHQLGKHGVTIFFVLSGFLITYLILEEKKKYQTIDIKKFYIRRILRIWPLYFLILLLGIAVLPFVFYPNYFESPINKDLPFIIVLSVFFLPNLVLIKYGSFFSIGVLWSIGVEEQFYLLWPWFINKLDSIKSIITLVFFYCIIKYLFTFLYLFQITKYFSVFQTISQLMSHDSIIIGALFGKIYYTYREKFIAIITTKTVFFSSISIWLLLLYLDIKFNINKNGFFSVAYALLYVVLIVNASFNTYSAIFEIKIFNYLGKISYGIYMYHSIVIALLLSLISKYLNANNILLFNLLFYTSSIIFTFIISMISYHYFEEPFINAKKKFMKINSSN